MALSVEFSRRSTTQLQKILEFYDKRNGNSDYSHRLLRCLLNDLQRLSKQPMAISPSTRSDVRFFYLMGFTVIFRYNSRRLTVLSIRSSARKPLTVYKKNWECAYNCIRHESTLPFMELALPNRYQNITISIPTYRGVFHSEKHAKPLCFCVNRVNVTNYKWQMDE